MSYRHAFRSTFRRRTRSPIRTRWRAPDDLGEALTAFRRAIITHRQLARLAPQFFDAALVQRERENRAQERRWMELWEPCIAKVYGVAPELPPPQDVLPPLPHPNTQRAVNHRLAVLHAALKSGADAMARHKRRNPHARPSLNRIIRMIEIAFDLKRLVLGLDSNCKLPEKITYDDNCADLKRAYGDRSSGSPAFGFQELPGPVSENPNTNCAKPLEPAPPARPENAGPDPLSAESVLPQVESAPRCDAWSRWARHMRHGLG